MMCEALPPTPRAPRARASDLTSRLDDFGVTCHWVKNEVKALLALLKYAIIYFLHIIHIWERGESVPNARPENGRRLIPLMAIIH